MTITLSPDLEAVVNEQARQKGVSPETLVLSALLEKFTPQLLEPRDEWERQLRRLATDCGVSLSNEALSSEGLYE